MIRYGDNKRELLFSQGDRITIVSGSYYFSDKGPLYATVLKDYYKGSTTKVPIEFDSPQPSKTIMRGTRMRTKTSLSPNSIQLYQIHTQEPEETPVNVADVTTVIRNMHNISLSDIEIENEVRDAICSLCKKFNKARISHSAAHTLLTIGLNDIERED